MFNSVKMRKMCQILFIEEREEAQVKYLRYSHKDPRDIKRETF